MANEIQKSAIYNENEAALRGLRLDGVRARLSELSTSQGGGSLQLAVEVGDASFRNSILAGIASGTPIYAAASGLAVGQCVVVTATIESTFGLTELSKTCDDDFFVEFESIAPCSP